MEGDRNTKAAATMTTVLLVAVAVVALAPVPAEGQPKPFCGSALLPCLKYFNSSSSSKPPETCCSPLRQAAADNMQCLCIIFNSTTTMRVYNGTTDDAFPLAGSCGVSAAILGSCSTLPPPVRAWWGDVLPPPPPPNSVDASQRTSWTKIWSFMMSVLFLWWSLMA